MAYDMLKTLVLNYMSPFKNVWLNMCTMSISCVTFLLLTEYCREVFEKFTTFLTSKKCRNWPVFG